MNDIDKRTIKPATPEQQLAINKELIEFNRRLSNDPTATQAERDAAKQRLLERTTNQGAKLDSELVR